MQVPPLKDKDLQELLRQPLVAKLATTSRRGDVRMSPVWFGAQDGTFVINTFEDSGLVKNLKRTPKCSLLIDSTQAPYIGVHYWGTATVGGPENDAAGIGRLFARYVGDVERATEYARKLIGWGTRVYVRFRPERHITWDFRES
jgi:PPOX class probable F420-dependent enzyme